VSPSVQRKLLWLLNQKRKKNANRQPVEYSLLSFLFRLIQDFFLATGKRSIYRVPMILLSRTPGRDPEIHKSFRIHSPGGSIP